MNSLKNYIFKSLNFSNILNENRIEKLRAQKVPENIINFVYQFSKQTVRNPEDENLVQQNQYIPWIASEIKKNEDLAKDEKLKVVINWINKSGFPRFPSNMPFDKAYATAVDWFLSKNIDPITLKVLTGGKPVITYPDGSSWIVVKDKNFCMRVGEAKGWCFNEITRATDFTKSGGGYMLSDKSGAVKMAVQFDKKEKKIVDWQGAFNEIPDKNSAMKSADLISKLGVIFDIEQGHQSTITKSLQQYPDFKKWMSSLENIKLEPIDRYLTGLDLTPEQLSSISAEDKVKHKIPLSDEELKSLHFDVKLKHGLKLTDEEIKNLSPIAKLAHGYKIKLSEAKLLPPLMQKIVSVIKGKAPDEVFSQEDFGDYKLYNNHEADNKYLELNVGIDWRDYAGFSDDDDSAFFYSDSNYAIDDGRNSEEEKYMSYSVLGEENEELLKKISSLLGKPIKEDEDHGIWNFIEENLSNKDDIRDVYLTEIYEKKAKIFSKEKYKILNKEQRFKLDFSTDIITFPWKKLLRFMAEKSFKSEIDINTFADLKEAEVNVIDGGYGLSDAWSNAYPKLKDLSYMQDKIKKYLEDDLEKFESNPELVDNSEEADYLLKKLGFIDENGDHHYVKMPNDSGNIEVLETNLNKKQFKVRITKRKGDIKVGFISFETLAKYVTMPSLFESQIRKIIRKTLVEDFRFMYDKQSFTPPTNVVYNVQKTLKIVQSNQLVQADGSNEGSGLQKAKSLISGEPLNHSQLKRMKAFFDKNADKVAQEKSVGKNITNSEIIQRWELWGGDVGRSWVEKEVAKTQSSNKTSKKVRNSDMIARNNKIMDPHNTRIHK